MPSVQSDGGLNVGVIVCSVVDMGPSRLYGKPREIQKFADFFGFRVYPISLNISCFCCFFLIFCLPNFRKNDFRVGDHFPRPHDANF